LTKDNEWFVANTRRQYSKNIDLAIKDIDKNLKLLESYKKKYLKDLIATNHLEDINKLLNRYRLQRVTLKEDKLTLKNSNSVLTKQMNTLFDGRLDLAVD
jgi:hypothetical protein